MTAITPSFVTVNPHYMMPDIIMQYSQLSGAFNTLATKDVMPRLGEGDLYVYAKTLDVRTKVAGSQAAFNQLPSVSMTTGLISTPTYLLRTRAEYDHHDTTASGNWGVALPEAQRLGMQQGIFQSMRNGLLFGFGASDQGLLNTAGATAVNLPADSNGNTTLATYDNGQLAVFLLQQIGALKTRMMQVGSPLRIVILAPQRVISTLTYQNIVQLTQYQRIGGGVASTGDMVEEVAARRGDKVELVCDDTLINAGAGGTTDAILMIAPEIKKPIGARVNTNVFATLSPSMDATTIQLCDMAAPREITAPLPAGAVDVTSELRVTPGWCIRPEALSIISIQYQ